MKFILFALKNKPTGTFAVVSIMTGKVVEGEFSRSAVASFEGDSGSVVMENSTPDPDESSEFFTPLEIATTLSLVVGALQVIIL